MQFNVSQLNIVQFFSLDLIDVLQYEGANAILPDPLKTGLSIL